MIYWLRNPEKNLVEAQQLSLEEARKIAIQDLPLGKPRDWSKP